MKLYLLILAALAFAALVSPVEAATCFWVGGTGTWSTSNTASWASSTGGTTGTCAATGGVPKQTGDVATFDASSGAGTVTVDSTLNGITLAQIQAGNFGGTLDFSVNNPSMTITGVMSFSGSGARTIKLGSGTFTLTAASGTLLDLTTTTNLVSFQASSTGLVVSNTSPTNTRTIITGAQTFGGVTVNSNGGGFFRTVLAGGGTIGTLAANAPTTVAINANTTISTALNINGTASNSIVELVAVDVTFTLTLGGTSSINYAAIGNLTFTGSPTATNSFDMGKNSGITITGPSGGGGRIIGG